MRRGQRTEPRDQLLAHPRGEELGEAALAVRDPERRVARVDEAARHVDEALEHLLDLEVDATASTASLTSRNAGLKGSDISFRGYVTFLTGNAEGRLVGSGQVLRCASQLISDIHGNWHALEAVLADVDRRGRRDLVPRRHRRLRPAAEPLRRGGAGARGRSACWATTISAAIGEADLAAFSPDAATSARWTIDEIEPDNLAFLKTLEPKGERSGVELFHASPRDPIWEYVLSEPVVRKSLELTTARLVPVGHSHIPIALRSRDGEALAGGLAKGGSEIELAEGRWLLNPGSVGQPRDGDPRAAYLLIDLDQPHGPRTTAAFPTTSSATQAEIREAGLPEGAGRAARRRRVGEAEARRNMTGRGDQRETRHRTRPLPGARPRRRRADLRRPLRPHVHRPAAVLGRRGAAAHDRRRRRRLRRRRGARQTAATTPPSPPAGRSSASSSRTTSPPTARRSARTPRTDALRNFRTPRLNLECLYGGGPVG